MNLSASKYRHENDNKIITITLGTCHSVWNQIHHNSKKTLLQLISYETVEHGGIHL